MLVASPSFPDGIPSAGSAPGFFFGIRTKLGAGGNGLLRARCLHHPPLAQAAKNAEVFLFFFVFFLFCSWESKAQLRARPQLSEGLVSV